MLCTAQLAGTARLYTWLSMFLTTPLIREFDAPSTARHTPSCPENLAQQNVHTTPAEKRKKRERKVCM